MNLPTCRPLNKTLLFLLLQLVLATGVASAQEKLPSEKVQKAVRLITAAVSDLKDPQIKLDLDSPKSTGIKGSNNIGLIAIPDKQLTADALAKVGTNLVPVGQLWLRGIAMYSKGEILRGDKLRNVTVRDNDKEARLQLYLLGARRSDQGMELVIFAMDKKPLLVVSLEPAESAGEFPIEVTGKGEKGKKDSAMLIVNLVGKYRASISIRELKD